MKRFNKILALFLVVVMTAGLLVTGVSAAAEDNTSDSSIILVEDFEVGDNGTFVENGISNSVISRDSSGVYSGSWNFAEPKNSSYFNLTMNKSQSATLTAGVSGGYDGSTCVAHGFKVTNQKVYVQYLMSANEDVINKMEDGATYVASVWVKQSKALKTWGVVWLTAYGTADGTVTVKQAKSSTEWTKLEVEFVYDESQKDSLKISIEPQKVEAVEDVVYFDHLVIEKKSVSLPETVTVQPGATTTLSATVTPAGTAITWSSDNEAVATVDQNGVVTGVAAGEANITVTTAPAPTPDVGTAADPVSATCKVIVKAAEEAMTYEALIGALAQEGTDPVALSNDVDGVGNDLVLKGKTLDLAGNTLTVDSLSALKGADVIDSVGGGKLAVAEGNLMLQKDNEAMPVKVEGGFVFTNIYNNTAFANTNDIANGVLGFKFKPKDAQNISDDFANYMKAADEHGLTVKVRMVWTNSQGAETVQEYTCGDSYLAVAYADGTACTITVNGVDGLDNLTVYCVLVSDTGVENISTGLAYNAAT